MSRDRKFWRGKEDVVHYRNRRPYNYARGNKDDYYLNDDNDDYDDEGVFFNDRSELDTFEYENRGRPFRQNVDNNRRTYQTEHYLQNKVRTKRNRYDYDVLYDEDEIMERELSSRYRRHRRPDRAYRYDDVEQEYERERYEQPLLEERYKQQIYDSDRDHKKVYRSRDYNDFRSKEEIESKCKQSTVENNGHTERNNTTPMNTNYDNRDSEMTHHHNLHHEQNQPPSMSLSTSSPKKKTENKAVITQDFPSNQNYSNRKTESFTKSIPQFTTMAQSSCVRLYGMDSSVQNSHLLSLIEQLIGVRAVQIKRHTSVSSVLHSSTQKLSTMEDHINQSLPLQGNNYNVSNCPQFTERQQGQQYQKQFVEESSRLDSMYFPVTLEFTEVQHAARALELLNGAIINGKIIVAAAEAE